MDGRANAGDDNISPQKLTPKKRQRPRLAWPDRCSIMPGDRVMPGKFSREKRMETASNKETAFEKQKGRHCADLSYRYDVLRQYIRGRGPKANCLQ
ncbi:hypothetical protein [Mesorhizobium sp. M7A.F.Ca.US.008.03.1.1]|uniref:hypothetical protein n=1 Tax=Mesorhizobium sp. M7A.F.Ca.US.008.03.1.1 TaxID=2496742 RepID=UPI000FCA6841|nr:hypothetical protein [Mesorhizobium sp. M7A.F.Ca.US.008.03.1.1]RUW59292.1 hypothetical protein EOA16_23955 [Mesorhizobium sp. M7A.F.Ca.US.008.03.1.1]